MAIELGAPAGHDLLAPDALHTDPWTASCPWPLK